LTLLPFFSGRGLIPRGAKSATESRAILPLITPDRISGKFWWSKCYEPGKFHCFLGTFLTLMQEKARHEAGIALQEFRRHTTGFWQA
jgi:hypothetical protein